MPRTRPIPRLTRETLAAGTLHLRETDRQLGRWIERVGPVGLRRQRHQFSALCRSIISQQLSSKAAKSIYRRFLEHFAPSGCPRPERLLALDRDRLRSCGLSERKVDYLRALAAAFHDGELNRVRLGSYPDDEVIRRLTRLPGIGVWTAEMFLIFALGRLDVFSVGDLALRSGVERVVGGRRTPAEIESIAARWSPYRSVASLYLWKISHYDENDSR